MMKRLAQNRGGATLTLQRDDILIAVIMPVSTSVHVAKFIVSASGDVEFAEWITGVPEGYTYNRTCLGSRQVHNLSEALARLGHAYVAIQLDETCYDPSEYEPSSRTSIRFWHAGNEVHTFLPTTELFEEFAVPADVTQQFLQAFDDVVATLPTEWINA